MQLQSLIKNSKHIRIAKKGKLGGEIKGITFDSRLAKKGFLFVAIEGNKVDGHKFVQEAVNKGSHSVLVQKSKLKKILSEYRDITLLNSPNPRLALAELASAFYGFPSEKLKITGVTGTNGKTTITYLIESIFNQVNFPSAVLGTVNYRIRERLIPADNTTPEPLSLQSYFADMRQQGISHVVMEVSSHSLDQDRVAGIRFDNAIFTNLTQDHLDYHQTKPKYFAAKTKLFLNLDKFATAIINIDDIYGRKLLKMTKANILTYAVNHQADVRASDITCNQQGLDFKVSTPLGGVNIKSKLVGLHNVYNILAAVTLGVSYGIDLEAICEGISKLKNVPGRLEEVDCGQNFRVFVDYAHTEDALKNVLSSLRKVFDSKIIVVFGCGGDRDKGKRPKMGRVVEELAHWAVVTSDNPRSENIKAIISDILAGMRKENHEIEEDRFKAIEKAMLRAKIGDVVLIAGKGHETRQIFKDSVMPFDDRQVAAKVLEANRQPLYTV